MNNAALFYVEQTVTVRVVSFVLRVNPNVSTSWLFRCISIPFVLCAGPRPTNKRNQEQKHVTTKLAYFITSLDLSFMSQGNEVYLTVISN